MALFYIAEISHLLSLSHSLFAALFLPSSQYLISVPNRFLLYVIILFGLVFFDPSPNSRTFKTTQVQMTTWQKSWTSTSICIILHRRSVTTFTVWSWRGPKHLGYFIWLLPNWFCLAQRNILPKLWWITAF